MGILTVGMVFFTITLTAGLFMMFYNVFNKKENKKLMIWGGVIAGASIIGGVIFVIGVIAAEIN